PLLSPFYTFSPPRTGRIRPEKSACNRTFSPCVYFSAKTSAYARTDSPHSSASKAQKTTRAAPPATGVNIRAGFVTRQLKAPPPSPPISPLPPAPDRPPE